MYPTLNSTDDGETIYIVPRPGFPHEPMITRSNQTAAENSRLGYCFRATLEKLDAWVTESTNNKPKHELKKP